MIIAGGLLGLKITSAGTVKEISNETMTYHHFFLLMAFKKELDVNKVKTTFMAKTPLREESVISLDIAAKNIKYMDFKGCGQKGLRFRTKFQSVKF